MFESKYVPRRPSISPPLLRVINKNEEREGSRHLMHELIKDQIRKRADRQTDRLTCILYNNIVYCHVPS